MRLMSLILLAALLVGCGNEQQKELSTMPKKDEAKTAENADAPKDATTDNTENKTEENVGNEITAADGSVLSTDSAKRSYVIGVNIGTNFRNDLPSVELDVVLKGMSDALNDSVKCTPAEMEVIMNEFQKAMMEERRIRTEQESSVNTEAAQKFLAENKGKEGVLETASGLQYKVLSTAGKTEKPAATTRVTVHYAGRLLDGSEFDSSIKRGEPATFGLNQVIKGWTEGLQLMSPGDKYELYIPAELGYGPASKPTIPANSLLIFEVELISIEG